MEIIMKLIIQKIVDYPNDVIVHRIDTKQSIFMEIQVNQLDIGKIIGKNGVIIDAIRKVFMPMGIREGKAINLTVIRKDKEETSTVHEVKHETSRAHCCQETYSLRK